MPASRRDWPKPETARKAMMSSLNKQVFYEENPVDALRAMADFIIANNGVVEFDHAFVDIGADISRWRGEMFFYARSES